MPRYLPRPVAAVLLSAVLALAGISATATPAAANGHRNGGAEAAAIFGGLLLLYGLSQANRNNTITRHAPAPIPLTGTIHQPPRQHLRFAPGKCAIQGWGGHGHYSGYRARCLENSVANPRLLPGQCLYSVWTENGQRRIYDSHCLSRNGWTLG